MPTSARSSPSQIKGSPKDCRLWPQVGVDQRVTAPLHQSLETLSSLLTEDGRDAPHDALDAGRALLDAPGLVDEVEQAVEDQQHAVVRLSRRDLEEAGVRRERQQSTLVAGDHAAMQQVPLVTHQHHGHGGDRGGRAQLLDERHLLPDHLEAGAVADAVHEDDAVGPAEVFLAHGVAILTTLRRHRTVRRGRTFRKVVKK